MEAQGDRQGYGKVYAELYRRYGISSDKSLPAAKFTEVMDWLRQWYAEFKEEWQTVFYHFRRLRLKGIWFRLLTALREAERERVGRDAQPSAAIIITA